MTKYINIRLIARILGSLLILECFFFVLCIIVDLYYAEGVWVHFLKSALLTAIVGVIGIVSGKSSANIGKREGSFIVTMTWLLFSLAGMLPFIFSGSIPSVTDAFFETMSGFTTTGASIMNNIEEQSHAILFWRSTTHWIGGLGIIVISMALLPVFGFSGVQLFSAEATGPTKDKIHPKISETAKRLLGIYIALTIAETLLLKVAGMTWFDAVCHSFSTIATGGFSTKQGSIGQYNSPTIEYIIIFFMILSGVNFSIYYFLVKQKMARVFKNEEFRTYLLIIIVFTVILILSRFATGDFAGETLEKTIRNNLFVVTSTISTTGFVTVDYGLWPAFTWMLLLVLMIIGSSGGSTAGGMKVMRISLATKYSYYELKRLIHPNAVFPVRFSGHVVPENVVTRILSFVVVYITLIVLGSVLLAFTGLDFLEALSAQVTCLSNVGPGFGKLGPVYSFAELPHLAKWILSVSMLIGRLELFTVLVIFTPVFWKR